MDEPMNDMELKKNVEAELDWEPSIDAAHIGVAVENGVVTLTGHVPTYAQKITAEQVAKRVRGVKAIAQEIEVRPLHSNTHADDEIAKRAVNMLSWDVMVPETVQVKVQQGWVTLSGTVKWQYEKTAAEDDIRKLGGVRGVTNLITIEKTTETEDIRARIEDALKRNAQIEASGIEVTVKNGEVTLDGKVHSWHERDVLDTAVWAAPGVTNVINRVRLG